MYGVCMYIFFFLLNILSATRRKCCGTTGPIILLFSLYHFTVLLVFTTGCTQLLQKRGIVDYYYCHPSYSYYSSRWRSSRRYSVCVDRTVGTQTRTHGVSLIVPVGVVYSVFPRYNRPWDALRRPCCWWRTWRRAAYYYYYSIRRKQDWW